MTKDILLGITGIQSEDWKNGTQGKEENEAVEIITSADYFFKNGKHYFVYDETDEGGAKIGKSKIKITGKQSVEIMKNGETKGQLLFEKDKRTLTCYNTPFGQIFLGIWTTGLDIHEEEDEISVGIRYTMELENSPVADCFVRIRACSKGEKAMEMMRGIAGCRRQRDTEHSGSGQKKR